MNSRIEKLRKKSLTTQPYIDIERAKLITEAYQEYIGKVPIPILRALSFKYLLENKTIDIYDGILIVGERGASPGGTPTYPGLYSHTLEDFDLIHKREKISFRVSNKVRKVQKEFIIPFWKEKSIPHQLLNLMDQSWKDCYESGIFTEFMEQRSPGHTVADGKIYQKGFIDFKKEIDKRIADLDYQNDSQVYQKRNQLKAMSICADAIILLAHRLSHLFWFCNRCHCRWQKSKTAFIGRNFSCSGG